MRRSRGYRPKPPKEPTVKELMQSVSVAKAKARKPKQTRPGVAEARFYRKLVDAAIARENLREEIDPGYITAMREKVLAEEVLLVARLAVEELRTPEDYYDWFSPLSISLA